MSTATASIPAMMGDAPTAGIGRVVMVVAGLAAGRVVRVREEIGWIVVPGRRGRRGRAARGVKPGVRVGVVRVRSRARVKAKAVVRVDPGVVQVRVDRVADIGVTNRHRPFLRCV